MSLIPGLPSEISRRIVSLLGAPYCWSDQRQERVAANGIASYATVSRVWQAEVEQRTFRRLYLTPNRISYALGQDGLLSPDRVGYIRSIHLDVLLASYDDAARHRVESDEDKYRNNETFSITVRRVVLLLGRLYDNPRKSLSGDRRNARQLTLILTAQSRSDPRPGNDFVFRRQRTRKGLDKDLLELRYQSSYLELLPDPDDDGETVVPHVNLPFTTFIVDGMPPKRFFSPAACCYLAARMPCLRQVKWQLWDNEKKGMRLRRRMRDELARAIPGVPSSIEDVELRLHYSVADDYSTPKAISNKSYDSLSAALGRWSRNLRELYVQVSCLSHDFFVAASEEDPTPSEPAKLRNLTVELSTALPSGAWLLTANPDEDDGSGEDSTPITPTSDHSDDPSVLAPEDRKSRKFRQSPAGDLIKPLIVNIAGAVGSLPELKRLDVSVGPRRAFSIVYDADDRLLEIQAVPKLVPEEEAMVAWKDAARVQIGRGHVLTTRLVRANVDGPPVEDVTEIICEL